MCPYNYFAALARHQSVVQVSLGVPLRLRAAEAHERSLSEVSKVAMGAALDNDVEVLVVIQDPSVQQLVLPAQIARIVDPTFFK